MSDITLKNFLEQCDTGDVLLFSTKKWYSRIIEFFTCSKFSHVAIILKDPIYINPELQGLYILESGQEDNPSIEDNKKKYGVQITKLHDIVDMYKDGRYGHLYYRKLQCTRNESFENKIKGIHDDTYDKPYDTNLIDWVKAEFEMNIGNEQRTNTFWCSALVAYAYTKLGFLDDNVHWTVVSPKRFSFYEDKFFFDFMNCVLNPEKRVLM